MSVNGRTYKFGIYLDMTAKAIKQDIIRRFREHNIELTPEQWAVLNIVGENEILSQKDLAESTFKDAPTVSRIIDLLTNKGFLQRTPDREDRRRIMVSLTPEGTDLWQKSTPIILEARQSGWAGLSEEDFENLKRILDKIYSNVSLESA